MSHFTTDRFAVLIGRMPCHSCKAMTRVSALLIPGLPKGQEDDRVYAQDTGRLQYITQLNPAALAAWQASAPWIRMLESATAGFSYWANACERCQSLQGDWYIAEPDAPFFPTSREGIDDLSCQWCDVLLSAEAEVSQSFWMDELLDRVEVRCRPNADARA